jgi:hypothetical protein
VRVNERHDPRNGMEGMVIERMRDDVTVRATRFRTLVEFEEHPHFTGRRRWYADENLAEVVDVNEGS